MIVKCGKVDIRHVSEIAFRAIMVAYFLVCNLAQAVPEEPATQAIPTAPDIVLIMVDSLRADALGCYGQALPTTPLIDSFAASGVRFEQAIASASWTQPSVMSTFTSLSPDRHGLVLPTSTLASNVSTLAENLRQAGYQTIGITANSMAHRRYGFARGFDHYDDYTVVMDPGGNIEEAAAQAAWQVASGATVTRLAVDWLRRRDTARPLFLFLFYMDPHWDYMPPATYGHLFTEDTVPPLRDIYKLGKTFVPPPARERIRAAYAGEVRYADDCIGRLLDALKATPRAATTAVALCGDHGESFWERGDVGHGNNLNEEEIRVPLIIRPPGPQTAGVVVTGQVGLIDLAPTFLDLAGIARPAAWEGVSLKPFLSGGNVPPRPLILDTRITGGHSRGVRTPAFKVIGRPPFDKPSAIYDLIADPGETNNLVGHSNGIPPAAVALIPLMQLSTTTASEPKGTTP